MAQRKRCKKSSGSVARLKHRLGSERNRAFFLNEQDVAGGFSTGFVGGRVSHGGFSPKIGSSGLPALPFQTAVVGLCNCTVA